jgi:acetolactate synthase-1/2/3 large subunit
VQHGPGAENAYAGVAQAFADGSPLLFLPGGNPAAKGDLPPNYDGVANFRGVTKWAARVNVAVRVSALLRRAFTLLRCGRPAPVLLEVPTDVAAVDTGPFEYKPAPALQRAIRATGFGGRPGRPALVEFITREETRLSKPW